MPQPAVLFDSATAEGRIARYFGVSTLDGFGTFSRAELAAASAAEGDPLEQLITAETERTNVIDMEGRR